MEKPGLKPAATERPKRVDRLGVLLINLPWLLLLLVWWLWWSAS